MAKVINLRRARKAKEREDRLKQAEANRRKHGRSGGEKKAARAEVQRLERAHRGARREGRDEPREAVCARCLGPVAVPELSLEGQRERTVYAADDLAFPAIALPQGKTRCEACDADVVPLVVRAEVASSIAAYLRQRADED